MHLREELTRDFSRIREFRKKTVAADLKCAKVSARTWWLESPAEDLPAQRACKCSLQIRSTEFAISANVHKLRKRLAPLVQNQSLRKEKSQKHYEEAGKESRLHNGRNQRN